MRLFQSSSIKRKLILISLATTGIALLLTSAAFIVNELASFRHTLVDGLTVQAEMIGSNSRVALAFHNQKDAQEILGALSADPNIVRAVIYTQDGEVFTRYQRSGENENPPPPAPQQEGYVFGINSLTLFQPIVLEGEPIGAIYIQSDLDEFYVRVLLYAGIGLAVFSGSLLVAYLLLSRLQRAITDPIMDLARLTGVVSKNKDYSMRAAIQSNDEMGSLALGFNEMLTQIQSRDSELELHRRHLEEQVTQRTAELASANERLQQELAERRRMDEKLQQYAVELKQSNEDVLSFAYIVSHDLRAPLVSIKGFTSELKYSLAQISAVIKKSTANLDEKERKDIETAVGKDVPEAMEFIGSSVNRMDGLINAVLTLSRLGRKGLKPEPIDMSILLQAILKSLAHQIEKNKVNVSVAELPQITADRLSMEQVMGNILDNALKYLEPGRDGEIIITAEKRAEEIRFHIRDNGRGIAKDDMHKVFEVFRRAGRQDVPGDGMGLAYVKTLVRRHGGRIWCESEPGKGTTFSFTIPAQSEITE